MYHALVSLAGVEPTTPGLGILCSIQLGYKDNRTIIYIQKTHLTSLFLFAIVFPVKNKEVIMQIHATAIQWHKKGILFLGPSGAGKSTAALLAMDKGARLIADDQVILKVRKKSCIASCPDTIRGKMEVRGVGIVDVKPVKHAQIDLVVFLTKDGKTVPRLPQPFTWNFENIKLPCMRLCVFDCAFCQRLEARLKTFQSFHLPSLHKCDTKENEKRLEK